MTILARRDGGALWRNTTRALVDGLIGLAVDRGDFAHFWPSSFEAMKNPPADAGVPTGGFDAESSRIPHGLVHAYQLLGYEPALTLAGKIIRFMRRYFYGADGSFLGQDGTPFKVHFHAHAHGLLAMLDYALTTGDQELMEFVVRSFEYAKRLGANLRTRNYYELTLTPGASVIGYFPEHVNSPEWEGSEICEVADMIAVALKLSEFGTGDYWDDADRWIRNMFAEGQLLSTDWVYSVPEIGLTNPEGWEVIPMPEDPTFYTTERVPERNLGAFAGWPAVNDWYVGNGPGIMMHCCTANGSQAIYRIWERIVRYESGKMRVNLLLNRASLWADVESYIPY